MHLNVGICPHWLATSIAPLNSTPVYKAVNIQLYMFQNSNIV